MTAISNNLEGGSNGTAISAANAGGAGNTLFDVVAGSALTFDTTHVMHGSLAYKNVLGTSGTQTYVLWAGSLGSLTSASDLYIRYYLYMTANPSANEYMCRFSQPGTSGGGHVCGWGVTSGGLAAIYDTGASTAPKLTSGATTIPLNQWVRVEGHCGALSATVGVLDLKVWFTADSSGTPDINITTSTANTGTSVVTNLGFGLEKSAVSTTVWFDDLAFSTVGFIGPASGAGSFSRTITDSIALSESIAKIYTRHISSSDSITLSGSLAVQALTAIQDVVSSVREKMPTRLSVEVKAPDASRYFRWAPDELAISAPTGMTFSTTMPGGFEQFGSILHRKPALDYSDLQEFSTITAYGVGGEPAWQGRLQATPRASGQVVTITPQAVGWQAALDDDNSARMIYIDIDLTHWTAPSAARSSNLQLSGWSLFNSQVIADPDSGIPAILQMLQAPWSPTAVSEVLYDAKGILLGSLLYGWKKGANTGTTGAWDWFAILATTDQLSTADSTANLAGAGPGKGILSSTGGKTYGTAQFLFAGASGATDLLQYVFWWTSLSVVGAHGLTLQGTQDFLPGSQGFLSSDIISHAVSTWAPKLALTRAGVSTIEATSFIIPHMVFLDPTTAGSIINAALQYEINKDWWVDEGPTFNMASRANHGRDWRARVGPSGLQETGPDVNSICNRVMITYNDVTGVSRTVGPSGSGADVIDDNLIDADPTNPLNQAGLVRYPPTPPTNIGTSTPAGAVAFGERFLAEQSQKSTAGQASLVGYVEDSAGIPWPSWMVRAGDRITFVDAHDPVARRIVKTNYTHDTRTNQIDLDSPAQDLDAVISRLGASVFGI